MCGNNDYIQELLLNYFFQCRSYVDFTIRQTENDIEIARVEGVTEAEVVDARAALWCKLRTFEALLSRSIYYIYR